MNDLLALLGLGALSRQFQALQKVRGLVINAIEVDRFSNASPYLWEALKILNTVLGNVAAPGAYEEDDAHFDGRW